MQIQTEQPKNGADEHILVCLSSSPSNARIIHTAAKMAKVLHAKFTAIYVQTDSVEKRKKSAAALNKTFACARAWR